MDTYHMVTSRLKHMITKPCVLERALTVVSCGNRVFIVRSSTCFYRAVMVCLPCSNRVFTVHSPCVHRAFNVCSPCVQRVFTVRSTCVHRAVIVCSPCINHSVLRLLCGKKPSTEYIFALNFTTERRVLSSKAM